jgi:hypothetical protein
VNGRFEKFGLSTQKCNVARLNLRDLSHDSKSEAIFIFGM